MWQIFHCLKPSDQAWLSAVLVLAALSEVLQNIVGFCFFFFKDGKM